MCEAEVRVSACAAACDVEIAFQHTRCIWCATQYILFKIAKLDDD